MKLTQIVLSSVLLFLPGCPQSLRGEGFSLQDLNPFAGREDDREMDRGQSIPLVDVSRHTGGQSPSIWGRLSNDLRRLNNGTKRFLANTADALCWKKKSPSPPPSRTSPYNRRNPNTQSTSSSNWFTPFWSREDPPLPKTPQEFVGMERPKF